MNTANQQIEITRLTKMLSQAAQILAAQPAQITFAQRLKNWWHKTNIFALRRELEVQQDINQAANSAINRIVAEHKAFVAIHELTLEQRDLCIDHLWALVAKDDDGTWTTVFEADTVVPREMADYLDKLAAAA